MDKQKQIEEMARIICKNGANGGDCDKCGFHKKCYKFKDAGSLYNAGYRKIPEGAVVLTREHEDKIFNDYVEYIKKVRKETAKKFAERLKAIAKDKLELYGWQMVDIDDIDEICEEFDDD